MILTSIFTFKQGARLIILPKINRPQFLSLKLKQSNVISMYDLILSIFLFSYY